VTPSSDFIKALEDFYSLAMLRNNYSKQLKVGRDYNYYLENKKIYNLTDKEYQYIINKYNALTFHIVCGFRTGQIRYYSLNSKDFTTFEIRAYVFYYLRYAKNNLRKGFWAKKVNKLMLHNRYKYNPVRKSSINICNGNREELRRALLYKFYEQM